MKHALLHAAAFVAVGAFASAAAAGSLPASKAVAAVDSLIDLEAAASAYPGSVSSANDTGWKVILEQQLKTANQKDLFIDVSLQSGIVTDTTVRSVNGSKDTSTARGTVSVKVEIVGPDGAVRTALPSTGRDATGATVDGIVFSDRIQTLSAKFSGLNCYADLDPTNEITDGAVICQDPEELQLILETLNANSFNFVAPDVVSGVHTIKVLARAQAEAALFDSQQGLAGGEAFLGAGAVHIEEVRMVKGTDVTVDLQ